MLGDDEKSTPPMVELLEDVAQHGHFATDDKGHSLVSIDPTASSKLARKMDFYILPMCFLLYVFCFIDRANLGNARLSGLEASLKLSGYDFNTLLSTFYVSYIVFEIPSNIACKMVGPGRWIPLLTFCFGILTFATAYCNSFASILVVRFLLGVAEAGVLPGLAYYLSRFYTKDELVFRICCFICGAPFAGAFGGLLASGILKLDGIGKVHTWQQIFFVEGLITIAIAIMAYAILADRPETARWLSATEKTLAEARIKAENPGMTAVVDRINRQAMYQGLFSVNTIVISFIFLFANIIVQGIAVFMPTIVRTIYPGRSVVALQLRTVPPYCFGGVMTLITAYGSWKSRRRGVWMLASAPVTAVGYAIFLATTRPTIRYVGTFFICGGVFNFGALTNAWASANVASDTSRSAAIAMVVMSGNVGGLISTWTFLPRYAPNFYVPNGINLAAIIIMFLLTGGLLFFQRWQNRLKQAGAHDDRLEGKTMEQIEALGIKHPGFRYVY